MKVPEEEKTAGKVRINFSLSVTHAFFLSAGTVPESERLSQRGKAKGSKKKSRKTKRHSAPGSDLVLAVSETHS